MKTKIIAITLITIVMLLTTACGKIKIPSGFKEIDTQSLQGSTITTYTGSGSQDEALTDFVKWAEKSGWSKSIDSSDLSISGYSGTILENETEMMVIQAYEVDGQLTVMVVTGPKE